MAQVQMQVYRGTSDYLDTISNVDGQFLYDEDTHQILVDNGTTREQYGGGNEKVYDTYAEAVADLANIADGQTVFVKEGTSSDKPTITYAEWQQLSDIEKEAFSGYVSNFPEEQLNASSITYGNTNVGAELTSINTSLADISQTVPDIRIDNTGRTNGQMLFMLLQQIDFSKVNVNTKLEIGANVFIVATLDRTNQHLRFSRNDFKSDGSVRIINANIQNDANFYLVNEAGTFTDVSNEAATAPFLIYY